MYFKAWMQSAIVLTYVDVACGRIYIRESLCFKFAKKSLKLPHFKKMFPVQKNLHNMEKRNKNKFVVNSTKTDRYMYMKSSIPSMQRLLNKHENIFQKALKNLVPVNVPNEFYLRGSLVEKI